LKDERGEFGVKQIAYTVAVIVVVGLVLAILRTDGRYSNYYMEFLVEKIQDLMG